MEFLDTQIISYKFKKNKEYFDGDIMGRQISSIVALEFLEIMVKQDNRANMYPVKLKNFSPSKHLTVEHRKKGFEIGKNITDKLIIDFNGEFDSIVIYANEAVSYLINEKNSDTLLFFARNSLEKEDFKGFRERVQFLINNEITVVPITQEIVVKMQCIYEDIKKEYNVKADYRNSFMDLLILATAIVEKGRLITRDNELNKVLEKCCDYLDVSTIATGISSIGCSEEQLKKDVTNDNKGYINNSWHIVDDRTNRSYPNWRNLWTKKRC
jgi:predicted nucleic acid-binding protein